MAPSILFEEGHILVFELYCLLGIVLGPLDRVLSNSKEIVKGYHREV